MKCPYGQDTYLPQSQKFTVGAGEQTGKRRRQLFYRDVTVQTCLTMKVLFGKALQQKTGFVESLLLLVGLDWDVPDFSMLSRLLLGG